MSAARHALAIAAVDHPKHIVFSLKTASPSVWAGKFFKPATQRAIGRRGVKVFKDFKSAADRYRVKAMRAAGTSALREASDSQKFLRKAQSLGVPLEVLSEKDEARLIGLGIMSGLRFHLPLGLFLDIGGGSVELTVADASNTFCLFSLPLGAVRLTEKFSRQIPPR